MLAQDLVPIWITFLERSREAVGHRLRQRGFVRLVRGPRLIAVDGFLPPNAHGRRDNSRVDRGFRVHWPAAIRKTCARVDPVHVAGTSRVFAYGFVGAVPFVPRIGTSYRNDGQAAVPIHCTDGSGQPR